MFVISNPLVKLEVLCSGNPNGKGRDSKTNLIDLMSQSSKRYSSFCVTFHCFSCPRKRSSLHLNIGWN